MSNSKFNINEFSSYKNVEGQYTDRFIKNRLCVKISESQLLVTVAVSEKEKENVLFLESVHFPKKVKTVIVSNSDFAEFIGNMVEKTSTNSTITASAEKNCYSLDSISCDAPVINIINAICLEAIRKNASDIHIQNIGKGINVRFRIDGVLQTVKVLSSDMAQALVSRIKVLSGLNVMENRLPQDGRMQVILDGVKIDLRVSIVPVTTGQAVVLRLFNYKQEIIKLSQLGFSENIYKTVEKAIHIPYGLILATGPTGSGKTTTLHAILEEMDKEHLKISTIEDPVERELDGVDQIQVNEEIGLTFERVLRRILRQDPDVIMVGEIRDRETAELAVRAALTGHVILSTLHTNDSVSAITRLMDLGIEPYLISSVLKYSIAQRLVRKKCHSCKGKGCESCGNTGYSGRIAIGEVFEVDKKIGDMIVQKKNDSEIKTFLRKSGFKTMQEDALKKLEEGVTTETELKREVLL